MTSFLNKSPYDNYFITITNGLADIAKSQYNACSSFKTNPTDVAGLLNRFYYFGWLN
jgi:hypothetical protein